MIIEEKALTSFFQQCIDGNVGNYSEVLVPVLNNTETDQTVFSSFSSDQPCVLDGFRPIDPVKILFYMARETVLPVADRNNMRIVAGVKACDIQAMRVLDAALTGGDFIDPAYKIWRDQKLVISSDCTDTASTCHCTLVGGRPFARSGFDVNLSRINNGFLVSSGSEKGEKFINELKKHAQFKASSDSGKQIVTQNRNRMTEKVKSQNTALERSDDFSGLRTDAAEDWASVSGTCIGCGACTNICPTCYCLILNDETKVQQFVKVRSYDSCQWHGYARVAGGASPRPKMFQRFRNRYLCKFLFMKSNFDQLGCTGCGRCTEACAGNIDFRKVIKHIVDGAEMPVLE